MDVDPPLPPSSAPKKPKFTPKAPPRRKTGRVLPKNEGSDDDDDDDDREAAQSLLRKVKERLGTRGSKVEKKSSGNAEKSQGAGSSSSMRTYGQPKDKNIKNSDTSNLRDSAEKSIVISSSTTTKNGNIDEMLIDDGFKSLSKTKDEYKEPWDCQSYYPISLPWRPPYAGDPEFLDKEEFGEELELDENNINSASDLGLSLDHMKKNEEQQMILFQFPSSLPLGNNQTGRIQVSTKGKEKVESSSSLKEDASNRCSSLQDLPNGFMGKMLVYKSGAIKFKLGDTIFDVSAGTPPACAQDVAVMNTKSKECCILGQLDKKAVVTPDFNSVLDDISLR